LTDYQSIKILIKPDSWT